MASAPPSTQPAAAQPAAAQPAAAQPAAPTAMPALLRVLGGAVVDPPPLWLMRQAGRYLPEYRALRAHKGGFLELVYDPVAAAEITLQPIRRFGFDAAILFSDILIVPHALGQQLRFTAGEGPLLSPPLGDGWLDSLSPAPGHLARIHETVALVRAQLPAACALIGFAGAPFTVATYMVAGEGSRDQAAARLLAYRDPEAFAAILDRIHEATLGYLVGQVDSGADALMLFDSWSGVLPAAEFERWVIAPTARLVAELGRLRPGIPVIGFPRGAREMLPAYARETAVGALALDEAVSLAWATANLPAALPLQGNLDPVALKAGGAALDQALDRLLDAMAGRPHILNLGHGIDKDTPVAHVARLVERLRQRA